MKIVITGHKGMLGRTLMRRLGSEHQLIGADLPEVDLTRPEPIEALLAQERPQAVIHAASMTAVDLCESRPEQAFAVNGRGSAHAAMAAQKHGARLIALSTDYVFRGDLGRPYHEGDAPDPRTVYGKSKLEGERAVAEHCADHVILRIAWLYGPGGPSFVHAMLKQAGQDGPPLKVVGDQVGNPTSTDAVAGLIAVLLEHPMRGIVHGTCEGEASWYQFAQEIFRLKGLKRGLVPCATAEFPRPAPRPANSRLEKRALRLAGLPAMPDWRASLERFFRESPLG